MSTKGKSRAEKIIDEAYKALIISGYDYFPIPISKVAKNYCCSVINNSDVNHLSKGQSGIIIRYEDENRYFIIVDENQPVERIRFTIGHELGHLFLGHLNEPENEYPKPEYYRISTKIIKSMETDADLFAATLLVPPYIFYRFNITSPSKIAELCHISITAAQYCSTRIHRMIKKGDYEPSFLETRIYDQFKNFFNSREVRYGERNCY